MGNEEATGAFNEIYDSTNIRVLAYITAKCCSTADIGDIFQETYTELFSVISLRGAEYIKNPEAFVITLAKRKTATFYSYFERRRMTISLAAEDAHGEEYDLTGLHTDGYSLEDNVANNCLVSYVHDHINGKDETTKKIFYLFYTLDIGIPAIAELLGVKESTVKNKLYRTLGELRAQYARKEGNIYE